MQRLDIDLKHPRGRANPRMTIIMLMVITNLYGLAFAKGEEIPYKVTQFVTTPGIYYDRLPNLRTFNDVLKLKIYRDEKNFHRQLNQLEDFEKKFLDRCQEVTSTAGSSCNTRLIREKFEEQIDELKSFGPVHESMPQIDGLFHDNPKCLQVLPDKLIHVTEPISEVYSEGINHTDEEDILILKQQISLPLANSKKVGDAAPSSGMADFLNNTTRKETAAKGYELELEDFVDAIVYARQGKIHRKLKPLENIASCIKQIHSRDQLQRFLDQSKKPFTKEEMIRLSKVDVAYENFTLIYTISIPLLDNDTFSLYRIHPVPVKQDHDNSGNKFAFIRPSDDYIAISKNRNVSMEFSEDFLTHCELLKDTYVCRQDQALLYRTETESESCEMALFLNEPPLHELLHLCDVMLVSFDGIYLSELRTPDSWIFVSPTPQTLSITCPGSNEVRRVPLSGSGVLQLTNRCAADNSGPAHLLDFDSKSSAKMLGYIPKFGLKLTEIVEIKGVDLSSDSYPRLNKPLNANGLKSKGLLLNEMIREANEFNRRMSPIVDQLWRATSFIYVVVFFGLLFIFKKILRITKLLRKCPVAGLITQNFTNPERRSCLPSQEIAIHEEVQLPKIGEV